MFEIALGVGSVYLGMFAVFWEGVLLARLAVMVVQCLHPGFEAHIFVFIYHVVSLTKNCMSTQRGCKTNTHQLFSSYSVY